MLSPEVARRTVLCQIDAQRLNAEERTGFRHDPLPEWIERHRGQLYGSLCVMIRAWLCAGWPVRSHGNSTGARTRGSESSSVLAMQRFYLFVAMGKNSHVVRRGGRYVVAFLKSGFASGIAARLAGITPRQLHSWAVASFAVPSIAEGRGKGAQRRWSFSDLVGLRVNRELLEKGISLRRVRRILPELRAFTGISNNLEALAKARLVVLKSGEVAVVADSTTLIELCSHPGQTIMASIVIELLPAMADIQRAMLEEDMPEVAVLKLANVWFVQEEVPAAA